MKYSTHSRRSLLGLTGALVTGGCLSGGGNGSSDRLPVLVGLTVANNTDQEHEYQLRVQFAASSGAALETVAESAGTIGARNRQEIDNDWPKEAGRYSVGISLDDGDWHTRDFSNRLTQEEQICYHQEPSINGGDISFPVDLNAQCPD